MNGIDALVVFLRSSARDWFISSNTADFCRVLMHRDGAWHAAGYG
jgi:hypothetical protein